MVTLNQEEGRYRVLLIGIGDNTQEEKESFSRHISKTYSIPFPLLKKIVDRCPIILKKNLSLKKAETLAKTLKSFGATVSVEERRNFPPVSLEFQELVPYRISLDSAYLRKTRGIWSVIGRARNISDETLSDSWVLVQLFDELEEFIAFEESPLSINPLPPGEISPFKVILDGDLLIRRASLAFKNASGEPIPALDERKRREWVGVEIEGESIFSSSWTRLGEKLNPSDTAELSERKVVDQEKNISEEPPSSESEGMLSLVFTAEPEIKHEEIPERFPEESLSLGLRPPGEIPDASSSLPKDDRHFGEQASEAVAEEEPIPVRFENRDEPAVDEGAPAVPVGSSEGDFLEGSRPDTSAFQEGTRLLDDISDVPGGVESEEKTGKRPDEEAPSFPWIEYFREAVQSFYQKPRDIFSIWFEECRKDGELKDSLHALLTVLVHSRFNQGSQSIQALENTQRVTPLIVQANIPLNEIPPLEGSPFVSGEVWRELFHRALPKVQQIGKAILERSTWKGFELENLIQVIPHMGQQNSRTATRWFKELIPDVLEVDFSETPVTVGEDLYRVASRLGIVDPHFDHYRGRNSMADLKIQSFAKMAYPRNPLEIEEPMVLMGRAEEQGGHCFPVQPKCEGCLFETFCPKLYVHFNPSEKGMRGDTP